jgi:putative phosphotransacetylase
MKDNKIYGKIAISNRHIHLTKEIYEKLFDEPLSMKKPISQIGEFASNETLTIKGPKGMIEKVRVMGPHRDYNQVEVSKSDAYILGLEPPVRESGDLEDSETITLITPKNEITLENVCILAERHVHMNDKMAEELGLKNDDLVKLIIDNDKGGEMEAFVKIKSNGFFEIHIDRDDANAFLLKTGDEVEIRKI